MNCIKGLSENLKKLPLRVYIYNRPSSLQELLSELTITSSQDPSYASPKLWPSHLLTGVKCRATSEAKKKLLNFFDFLVYLDNPSLLDNFKYRKDIRHNFRITFLPLNVLWKLYGGMFCLVRHIITAICLREPLPQMLLWERRTQ